MGSLVVVSCMCLVATDAKVAWIARFERGGRMLFPFPARRDSGWNHGCGEEEETAEKDCQGALNAGVPEWSTVEHRQHNRTLEPESADRSFHDHVLAASSSSVGTHRRVSPRLAGQVRLVRAGARGRCYFLSVPVSPCSVTVQRRAALQGTGATDQRRRS